MLKKIALLSIVVPIASHIFNVRNNMDKRNARMVKIYKRLYSTTGMNDNEILAAALRLTGQQG